MIWLGLPDIRLHKGVVGWVGCHRRQEMCVLPHGVFLREVSFKILPHIAFRWPLVPPAIRIGELARGEDQVVSRSHNLLRRVRGLSGVGEVHGRLNLFDDGIERLVDIVRRIHTCRVELEVFQGDLVIVSLGVINQLEES